nr:hypothetical protein OAM_10595 [Vibrio cyclitrophicus ZF14]PMF50942.1 hypothetical protein BCV12_18670 [Vibrio cyclitrophicus]
MNASNCRKTDYHHIKSSIKNELEPPIISNHSSLLEAKRAKSFFLVIPDPVQLENIYKYLWLTTEVFT